MGKGRENFKATGVSDMADAGFPCGEKISYCLNTSDAPVGVTVGVAVSFGERYAFKRCLTIQAVCLLTLPSCLLKMESSSRFLLHLNT